MNPNPIFVGLKNYLRILNEPLFKESLIHTIIYVVAAVTIETLLGLGIALMISEEEKIFMVIRTILIIPMVLAPVVVGILWRIIFNVDYGLLNYILGFFGTQYLFKTPSTALASCIMVDIWMYTPYMMILFVAGLKSLPVEPFEAAKVDGASRWNIFRFVTLPMLKPVLVVAILLRTLAALKVFDLIYVLTFGGPGTSSEVLTMTIYKTGFKWVHLGYGATMSWSYLIITMIPSMYFIIKFLLGEK